MARHHAAGEEMLRDPVFLVGAIEQIGAGTMAENVHEEAAIRRQPRPHPRHQFAPVHHVLEHFDRHDAVELPLWDKHIHVLRDHAKIGQPARRRLALDIVALRMRVRHRGDLRCRETAAPSTATANPSRSRVRGSIGHRPGPHARRSGAALLPRPPAAWISACYRRHEEYLRFGPSTRAKNAAGTS